MKILKTIILLAVISFSNMLNAQVPSEVNFRTVVRTPDGELVKNEVVNIRLSFIDNSTSPALIAAEESLLETDDFGMVSIDFGEQTGWILSDLNWEAGEVVFRVEYSPNAIINYETLEEAPVYAVPFAFVARASDNQPQNIVGPIGPAGPTGFMGAPGPAGPQGQNGPHGPTGLQGEQGPPGSSEGAEGAPGPPGAAGQMSEVGGEVGPIGPTGATGLAGPPGIPGAIGPTPPSFPPSPGPTGPTGPFGGPGANGLNGANGFASTPWESVSGNVYLDDLQKAIILTSTNGECWELKMVNGLMATEAVSCP